jgi:hypothetical protein
MLTARVNGNLALLVSKVPDHAFVFKKMRAAGIVHLGHANESKDADYHAVIFSRKAGQIRMNSDRGAVRLHGYSLTLVLIMCRQR